MSVEISLTRIISTHCEYEDDEMYKLFV